MAAEVRASASDTASVRPVVAAHGDEVDRRSQGVFLLMLVPVLLFLGVLFAYPLVEVLLRSVVGENGPTLEHYQRIVDRPVYLRVLLTTVEIAALVTVTTLLMCYPVAYVLAGASPTAVRWLLPLVLVPFFTSLLVRTYAWMVILGPSGILNQLLGGLGLPPATLLYNRAGVILGMVYALSPYMVLTLFSVMRGIDRNLVRAAHGLGAGDFQAFRRIFFPLSLPGVVGGTLLVFILSLGYFITPRMLGGNRDQMIASIIEFQVSQSLNWGFAAALAVLLLVVTLIGFGVYNRIAGLQSLFESRR